MKYFIAVLLASVLLFGTSCEPVSYETFGDIAGEVVDAATGTPVSGALITLSPGGKNAYTGSDGLFEFNDLDAIQYTISVQSNGYATDRKTITVIAGELQRVNFALRNN